MDQEDFALPTPTREDVGVVIDALRTLMTANEIFGTGLIPRSYASFHEKLCHSLQVRDLVRNEFASARSAVTPKADIDQQARAAWLAALQARRAALKETT